MIDENESNSLPSFLTFLGQTLKIVTRAKSRGLSTGGALHRMESSP